MSTLILEKIDTFKSMYKNNPSVLILSNNYYNMLKEEINRNNITEKEIDLIEYYGMKIFITPVQEIIRLY